MLKEPISMEDNKKAPVSETFLAIIGKTALSRFEGEVLKSQI